MHNRHNKKSRFARSGFNAFHVEPLEYRRLLSASLSVSQSLMVFNAVENSTASPVETLTLTNTGDAALSLTGLSVVNDPNQSSQNAAQFTMVNTGSAPSSLAPGASFGLQVQYTANAIGLQYAVIDISSSDPINPVDQVELHGIGTAGLGGASQPSLELILQAYDLPNYNDVGETNEASAYYPQPPTANSDEVALQELVKAGTGPVTINVLASFTAASTKPYTLGWYSPADPSNSQQQLFYTPTSEAQSVYVQPQGVTSFDPGSSVFGFYNPSATVKVNNQLVTGYTQDDLNTWDTTDSRKFRFFPYQNSSGTIVPNSYIMTSTEWYNPSGYDFTNMVAIVSNVMPAPGAPTGPVLSITNPVALVGSDTLIFNRIQGPNPNVGDTVHDTNTISLENTGQGNLTISNVTVTATTTSNGGTQYQLVNPPTFPFTLTPGQSKSIEVQFVLSQVNADLHSGNETNSAGNGGGGSAYPGVLTITSNDLNAPTTTIPMEGWWQQHSENSNEPSVPTIVDIMAGWGTDIAPSGRNLLIESTSPTAAPTYYGQEVVSPYWAEADPTEPVEVQQIDAFHTEGATSGLKYFPEGSPSSTTTILGTGTDVGQTFFPTNSAGTAPATGSFTTTENFGFEVLNPNTYSDGTLNVNDDASGHLIRFYPVITAAGALVPNAYILAIDYPTGADENFDFNDNVYLITNVHPVSTMTVSAPQTTGGAAAPGAVSATAGAGSNTLQWEPVIDSSLVGYDIYSSLSPLSGYTLLNTTPVTGDSYVDSTALPGETVYYRVAAVDSIGVGLGTQTSVLTSGTASNTLQSNAIAEVPTGSVTTITTGTAYTVVAGGPGVTGTTDGFQFLDTSQAGNFDVAVQVSSITVAGNFATAGIMARDGVSATGANVYMSASPVNYRFKDRSTDGGSETLTVGADTPVYPDAWVRLTRVGNVFTGYSSPDGIIWTMVSSVTLANFPTTCYLGLAVASNDNTQTTTAQLSSYGATPVYNGPVTTAETYTVGSGQTATESVLVDDVDPTGTISPGTFTITSPPDQGGTASFNAANGMLSYTSAAGFTGVETLTYTVADNNGVVSSPTTVTFDVVEGGPVGVPSTFQAVAGQLAELNVLAGDTDATSTLDPTTVTIVTPPASGASVTVDPTTGMIAYLAPSSFTGTDTFTYTVADENGGISVATTVTVDVSPSTTGGLVTVPIAVNAIAGKATTINVLAGDSDTSATILANTVVISSAPNKGGSAKVNSNGTITYTAKSSYSGIETFTYTVQDSAGYTSAATLVTVTVGNPSTAPILTSTTNTAPANGALTVNVAGNADTTVGLDLSTLAIGISPINGTVSLDTTTGVITYTPNPNFVGPDSFTYTVADTNGHTSNAATVSVNVGVNVGNAAGDERSLTFTSAGGAVTTISLNRGTVTVLFTDVGTLSATKQGKATVTGSSLQISGLQLTNTTAASSLSVSSKGGGALDIQGISDSSPIKSISAPKAILSGTVSLNGIASLQVLQAIGANITVGKGIPAGFTMTAGTVDDSTLASSVLVKSIKATSWTSAAGASSISAPSISSLVTAGNFQAKLSTTGGSLSLKSVHIGGQVGVGIWTVNGNARSIFAGSIAAGWAGLSVSGNLAGFTTSGNLTANISAGSINTLKVAGVITSNITTTGNLLSLQASQLIDAVIDVGSTAAGIASASASNVGASTLGTLRLTSKAASAFSDASVIAHTINSITTGPVNLASDTAEGIAADLIKSAAVTLAGGVLHFNARSLLSDAAIQTLLNQKSATLGTFAIDIL